MELIQQNVRSLSLLMRINWDRLLFVATIAVALGVGAWIGTLLN